MAIEDAAALGILFSKTYFNGDIAEALSVYQKVRLPRATRVQSAAAKAAYNINERIGKYCPIDSFTGIALINIKASRITKTFLDTKLKMKRRN